MHYGVLNDLGWRYATIDLKEYAGQTIEIACANYNRWDMHYNTWTLLDDVQIVDREAHLHRYLPLLSTPGEPPAAATSAAPDLRPPGGWQAR